MGCGGTNVMLGTRPCHSARPCAACHSAPADEALLTVRTAGGVRLTPTRSGWFWAAAAPTSGRWNQPAALSRAPSGTRAVAPSSATPASSAPTPPPRHVPAMLSRNQHNREISITLLKCSMAGGDIAQIRTAIEFQWHEDLLQVFAARPHTLAWLLLCTCYHASKGNPCTWFCDVWQSAPWLSVDPVPRGTLLQAR